MEIKLDFEQRHRANEMLEQISGGSDLELFVFEFVATRDAYNKLRRENIKEHLDEIARLRNAIQRAIDDQESGAGWGPDITVCGYLRDALMPPIVMV